MNNKLVNVAAREDFADAETGEILFREEKTANLNREQYAMIQASYESGKFKYMSEDRSLTELWELFDIYDDGEED